MLAAREPPSKRSPGRGLTMKITTAAFLIASIASAAGAADLAPASQPPAVADNSSGFYFGSLSSIDFLKHTDFAVAGTSVSTKYETGFYSAIRGGYSFGSLGFISPRVELEAGYGSASVDEHRVRGLGGIGGIDSYGDANSIQGFVNGYIDIPLTQTGDGSFLSAFTPYLGGGVGGINLKLRKQGIGGAGTLIDDDDTAFAYHFDAGVGINLQSLSIFTNTSLFESTTLDIGYRYTAADGFDFTARDGSTSSTDFRSNAVTVGLRKRF
jgi:opacity protein-like surface antigen